MLYISLGSNCSVTYHLIENNLRKKAYPFDWSKISIKELIDILENDFNNFVDTIELKKISYNHNSTNYNYSFILSNIYNIYFAHEIFSIFDIDEFKNKLNRRIQRFKNINDTVIFIRIELQSIKHNYYNYVIKLLNLLDKYCKNYILKLILNTDINFKFKFPENVQIYKFDCFSSDWKMNCINWNNLLL
jgi:hypothetical protein